MVEAKREEWAEHLLGRDASGAPGANGVGDPEAFARFERESNEALARLLFVPRPGDAASEDVRLASTRARLLANLQSEARFQPFFETLCRHFALGVEALRSVLRKVDDPASYQAAPVPGMRFFHFAPGATAGFAEAGVVKLAKGARFPRHQHLGNEINFVLEGTLIDADIAYGPGSAIARGAGTIHDYTAGGARDLLLIAGHNGFSFVA